MSVQFSVGNQLIGKQNAAANTVVYSIIPGGVTNTTRANCYTGLISFSVTAGTTANAIYVMRAIGRTTTTTTAAGNTVAALTLAADPSPTGNTISAGDQVVIEGTDGVYYRNQVNTSGWNATTLVVTFTSNMLGAVTNGSRVYMMGIFSDTDPTTGSAFPFFQTTANTTSNYPTVNMGSGAFLQTSARIHEPLMLYNPNGTDATVVNYIQYGYSLEG